MEDSKLEKVINGLEMSYMYSNVDEDNTLVPQQLLIDALELLKAQEPVKPKVEDAWPKPLHICANCGSCLITTESYKAKYCVECGRAVKWDG